MNKVQNISVVVCAYTEARWDELVAAVVSLQAQSYPVHEIIIVIDHNPTLLERVRVNISGVTVIENHLQRGLSGARNSGIEVVTGDIIAFMDEDAVADSQWAAGIMAGYADPTVCGVGGAIRPMWLKRRPAWFHDEFDWVVGCTYRGMPTTVKPIRNMIGCNMSFRADVFQTIEGFQSGIGRIGTIPLGCEETELCIRLLQTKPDGLLLYDPAIAVDHRVPSNRGTWAYFRSRCYSEGLSKALVSQFVGARDGLSSEWTYTLKTLPQGVLRGFADTILRRDLNGLRRAVAIIAGLVLTTTGFLVGKYDIRKTNQPNINLENTATEKGQ
jgi:glycosyltransferase involved in cell wall biosynthesis